MHRGGGWKWRYLRWLASGGSQQCSWCLQGCTGPWAWINTTLDSKGWGTHLIKSYPATCTHDTSLSAKYRRFIRKSVYVFSFSVVSFNSHGLDRVYYWISTSIKRCVCGYVCGVSVCNLKSDNNSIINQIIKSKDSKSLIVLISFEVAHTSYIIKGQ